MFRVKGQTTTKANWADKVRFIRGYLKATEYMIQTDVGSGHRQVIEGRFGAAPLKPHVTVDAYGHNHHATGVTEFSGGDLVATRFGGAFFQSESYVLGFRFPNANRVLVGEGLKLDWTVNKTSVVQNQVKLENITKHTIFQFGL